MSGNPAKWKGIELLWQRKTDFEKMHLLADALSKCVAVLPPHLTQKTQVKLQGLVFSIVCESGRGKAGEVVFGTGVCPNAPNGVQICPKRLSMIVDSI